MRTLSLSGATVDLATGAISGDRPGRLTTRELSLLVYLAAWPGETISRDTLLTDVFGYSETAVSRAVDKAMNSLREKVEVDPSAPVHLLTVTGTGYRFLPGPSDAAKDSPAPVPLPVEVDAFVGREGPRADLRALLARPGLVVLLGTGGIGKTRLALALAREAGDARFVDLSGARSREDLLGTVGARLGVPLTVAGVPPEEQLGRAIAALGPRIVVLDNFEHLTDHADLLDRWCRAAPEARLLVTSRRALGLAVERLFRLAPLPVDEGVALLILRAARRGVDLARDADTADLVRRLDGLPLALELAAARLGLFEVRELAARLDDRLRLLRSRDPLAPSRHGSLTATLDWSWSLLDGAEQTAMAELSVFPTDFTVDAAEAVLRPPDGAEILDVVDRLLDASLLQRRAVNGTVRLCMLETVRLYAAERLAALAPETARRAGAACTAHYVRLGEASRDGLGPDGALRLRRLSLELDHLVAACRRAVAVGDGPSALSALRSVAEVCTVRGPHGLYVSLARSVDAMTGLGGSQRAEATWQLGRALTRLDGEEARVLLERALDLARELGERALADRIRVTLAVVLKNLGRRDEARLLFEALATGADPVLRATSLRELAVMVHTSGAYEESFRQFANAEAAARAAGDLLTAAITRNHAVWTLIRLGRLDEARAMLEPCLEVFEAFGAQIGVLHSQATLGQILVMQGQGEPAMAMMRAAADGFRALGDNRSLMTVLGETGDLLCNEERYDEALVCLAEAETLARAIGDLRAMGAIGGGLAGVLVGLGRIEEALDRLVEARELLRPMGTTDVSLSTDLVYADTLRAAGRRDQAIAVLDAVERTLAERGHTPGSQLGQEVARIRSGLG